MGRPKGSSNKKPTLNEQLNQEQVEKPDEDAVLASAPDDLETLARKQKEVNDLIAKKTNIQALSNKARPQLNFNKYQQKLHHLYKLEVAKIKKNVGLNGEVEIQEVEHVHFFHSIDRNGVEQFTTVPTGGHFHELKLVKPATANEPPVYECSPALKKVKKKDKYGRWTVATVPYNGFDNHTHDVKYIRSEEYIPVTVNPEFAKFHAMMQKNMPSMAKVEAAFKADPDVNKNA